MKGKNDRNTLLRSECIQCLAKQQFRTLPEDANEEQKLEFLQRMCGIFSETPMDVCAPVIVRDINELRMEVIRESFPQLRIKVLVKGKPVANDVTMEDALEIGLQVVAEVVISKGQANYETLRFCERNVYYIFLCKCEMFCKAFQVPRYTGVLVHG